MAGGRLKSKAKPELLTWARESARLSIDEVAARAAISVASLSRWESGDDAPSIAQLRKLGEIYKRPIAVFYLPAPPTDFDPLRDFRRLPAGAPEESPALASEIRWAYEMREVALEAFRSNEDEHRLRAFGLRAQVDEEPLVVSRRLLKGLGIVVAEQRSNWKNWYDAYGTWRGAIERVGVLCLQITGVDVSEARGFAINESRVPVIAVNASDAPAGRIFTLLHELVHLMLGTAGKCDLHELGGNRERDRIEVFCNAVAGEALVPSDLLRQDPRVRGIRGPIDWGLDDLRDIANSFRVSREVILRRLLHLGFATPAMYASTREQLAKFERDEKDKRQGGGDYYNNLKSKLSMPLIRGVIVAWQNGKLTANEAAAYLRIKVSTLATLADSGGV